MLHLVEKRFLWYSVLTILERNDDVKYLHRQNAKDTAFGLFALQTLLVAFSVLLGGAGSILNFLVVLPISFAFILFLSFAEGSEMLLYKGVSLRFLWFLSLAIADFMMVYVSLYKLAGQPLWFFLSKLLFYFLYFLIQILNTKAFRKLIPVKIHYWLLFILSVLQITGIFLSTLYWMNFLPWLQIWMNGIKLICFLSVSGFALWTTFNRRTFDYHYRFMRANDFVLQFTLFLIPIWSIFALFVFS